MNIKMQRLTFRLIGKFGNSTELASQVPFGLPTVVRMIRSELAADFPYKYRKTMENSPDHTNRASFLVGIPSPESLPDPPPGQQPYSDGVDYVKRLFPFATKFKMDDVFYSIFRTIPLASNDVVLYLELVCDHG